MKKYIISQYKRAGTLRGLDARHALGLRACLDGAVAILGEARAALADSDPRAAGAIAQAAAQVLERIEGMILDRLT